MKENRADRDETISQQVIISEHAQAGNITLVGKIVNIFQRPSSWQEAIWEYASKRRGFLVVAFFLQTLLAVGYLSFRNLYLIPLWLWALAAVLLLVGSWGWYACIWIGRNTLISTISLLATALLMGVVASQARSIAFPEHLNPQTFNIVLAELGEGPGYDHTGAAKEISDVLYERLCGAVRKAVTVKGALDPCGQMDNTGDPLPVAVTRIGIIPDSKMAKARGQQIGADIMIWGQILSTGSKDVTIRFQVMETLDKAVNPDAPIILPVTSSNTEIIISEIDLAQDLPKLKEVVANQSVLISSFTLGLDSYLRGDQPQATNYFSRTVQTLLANLKDTSVQVSPEGQSLLFFYLGRANGGLGQFDVAEYWLAKARVKNSQEPAVPLALALVYGAQGLISKRDLQLQTALELIETWLTVHPEDTLATYDRGIIYQILGKNEFALLDFETVTKRDPRFYIAYISAGQSATALGRYDQARADLQVAIQLANQGGTNSAWAHLNLAMSYEKAEQWTSAKNEYMEAIRVSPKEDWMYYYFAQALENQKEMDAALVNFEKLVEVTRKKGWGYGVLGSFLRRRGLLEEAKKSYVRAVHDQPDDALLHTYLAETYAALGDFEHSLAEYREAVANGNELSYVHASYGGVLYQTGKGSLAAEEYEKALELAPLSPSVLLNLGQTYLSIGQTEKATEIYYRVLISPDQFSQEVVDTARGQLRALGIANP